MRNRDVAQFGSALALGASGCRFKSGHPDHSRATGCRIALSGVIGWLPKQARYRAALRPDGSSLDLYKNVPIGVQAMPILDP